MIAGIRRTVFDDAGAEDVDNRHAESRISAGAPLLFGFGIREGGALPGFAEAEEDSGGCCR